MTEQENEIWSLIEKEKKKKQRAQVFAIMSNLLLVFTLGLFFVSPFLQMVIRAAMPDKYRNMILTASSSEVVQYQQMIRRVHQMARFVAAFLYIYGVYYIVTNRREIWANKKAHIIRILPLLLFWLMAIDILLVTKLRGPNEYDLTGHPYMYESIYSYMTYAVVYFFCGAMLKSVRVKKGLLLGFLISSIPLNIAVMINKWVTTLEFLNQHDICAVFHNRNHYGYYLVVVIVTAAIMFVYETKLGWRIVEAVCAVIGMILMVPVDTLGAFLGVLTVFICFVIYTFIKDRKRIKWALIVLGTFLLITLLMSLKYGNLVSSAGKQATLIGEAAADPEKGLPDGAGSGRLRLWKGTIAHLPESPWTGFGVEGLLNTYHIGTPHNELLQYAEFFGIPATLLYIAAVVMIIVVIMRRSESFSKITLVCFCTCIGYLVSSLFGVQIYYTTPFIYIFLGLTYSEILRGRDERKEMNGQKSVKDEEALDVK
ncbi:MAG: O-antigen ligase family protein [Lachnospiraceae bacterium]|nr:O-antigen ligase family protein [Lachnospiraceae bacterium]